MKFPRHAASLHLTHNDHKSNYMTAAEAIAEDDANRAEGHALYDWVNDEQKAKAIETNDFWHLQWYPNTPVGFCSLAAADLDVLLAAATEDEQESDGRSDTESDGH